ncbi:MAG: hypothetical protein ACRDKB_13185 [Actinomycetota bacterium]
MVETLPPATAQQSSTPDESSPLSRALGHPLAFLATVVVLLAVFGGTFVLHPGRSAPTRDPAFYTWRTEALLTEEPETLIEIEGPKGLYSGGYRVSAPVIGGLLRRIPNVAETSSIAFIMVVVPVVTSLLLAGFAYRYRRDPLLWHAVAIGSAGLMLTPAFVGYLDNVMSVMFLAAALWFIEPARNSWRGRVGFGFFLVITGVTHTTTLAVFGLALGAMSAARLLFGRFEGRPRPTGRVREVLAADGPMLATAFGSAVITVLVWAIGVWGRPAPLSESATVFPYESSFFLARLEQWVSAMRPALNGPLLVAGVAGLLAGGRSWVHHDLGRVSIVWLAPLVGTFGFVAGLSYPYFRFFNTTLAWVLLVGLGAYFVARFFFDRARGGGRSRLALIGVGAVAAILATNFTVGLEASAWSDPDRGWLTPRKQQDLDALRANLDSLGDVARPIVFITDVRPPRIETLAQVWGITQVNGNTARYGLPDGQIDQGFVYQGALASYLANEPTVTGNEAYDDLAAASLEEVRDGIEAAGEEPLVVVASIFNQNGPNAAIATGDEPLPATDGADVWLLHDGEVTSVSGNTDAHEVAEPLVLVDGGFGSLHIVWILAACALLVAPGIVATRWFLPGASFAEILGMGPALAMGGLVLAGVGVLAVARAPLSEALAWTTLALTAAVGTALGAATMRRGRPGAS